MTDRINASASKREYVLQNENAAKTKARLILNAPLKSIPWPFLIALCFLASFLMEIFAFNSFYFSFDEDVFARREISLPFHEQLKRPAVVLDAKNPTVTVNDLNFKVQTIAVETAGSMSTDVHGSVQISDSSSFYRQSNAATFVVVPSDLEYNRALIRIISKGELNKLTLSFTAHDLGSPLVITSIVLNEPPALNIMWLRIFLLGAALSLLALVFKFQLYKAELDFNLRSHRFVHRGLAGLFVLLSFTLMLSMHPQSSTGVVFDINGIGTVPVSNRYHSLLLDLPHDLEELSNSDAYVQLLDAFLKGQLNLDVYVDPKLNVMANPYDSSARDALGVQFYWDRPFYDGKYYVYFGLAPLVTAYFPVYLLTSKVPSLQLACFILTVLAVIGLMACCKSLSELAPSKSNALLFFAGESAVVFGSMIFVWQMSLAHYGLPYLCATAYLSLSLCCLIKAYLSEHPVKRRLFLAGSGTFLVLLVMSRPLVLIFLLLLAGPLLFATIKKTRHPSKRVYDLLCVGLPVLAGAIIVCTYNYARFDTIFEFGQFYQLTVMDIRQTMFGFEWPAFKAAFYHFILEDFTFLKDFPFVELNSRTYGNYGNYQWVPGRAGILAIPLCTALFLLLVRFFRAFKGELKGADWALTAGLAGCLILMPAIAYLEYCVAGLGLSYSMDLGVPALFMSFYLLIVEIKTPKSINEAIVYAAALYLSVKTVFIGFFLGLIGTGNYLELLHPRVFLYVKSLFDPWVY